MSPLARAVLDALRDCPEAVEELRDLLAIEAEGGRWLSSNDAAGYLGLGSLDALDRLVRDGLPCSQPHGPGGRRHFNRKALDDWMESRR